MCTLKKSLSLIFVILILTITTFITVSCWSEPAMDVRIENQTNEKLAIYLFDRFVGWVYPGEITQPSELRRGGCRVIAHDSENITVYNRYWELSELKKVKFVPTIQESDLNKNGSSN